MNSPAGRLPLAVLAEALFVCRLASPPPPDLLNGKAGFTALIASPGEVTLICDGDTAARLEPPATEGPWRALYVVGTLDFSLTGIIAGLTAPLAAAAVPVFVVSTFATDYLLVPADRLGDALDSLGETCDIQPNPFWGASAVS